MVYYRGGAVVYCRGKLGCPIFGKHADVIPEHLLEGRGLGIG